jgi:rod shape-determining protein MreD
MARVDKNQRINIVLSYFLSIVFVTVLSTLLRWLGPEWLFSVDLYLVAALVHALRHRPMSALLFGLVLGFSQDVYGGSLIGLNALSKMVLCYLASSVKDVFLIRGVFQGSLVIAIAVAADHVLRSLVLGIFSIEVQVTFSVLLPAVGWNLFIGILVLLFKAKFSKTNQVEKYEEP